VHQTRRAEKENIQTILDIRFANNQSGNMSNSAGRHERYVTNDVE
jgi:hypothetical protein